MTRTLASIETISELNPISGADKIEVARIKGWNVVVRKGEFNVGDKVVYCEVDSVLPERPEFEFLKDKHYRIRTAKLRGQVSQGICFPLTVLNNGDWQLSDSLPFVPFGFDELEPGFDVTKILGITKYEKPIPVQLRGRMRGPISRLAVPKTDETRVQNIPDVLERHKGVVFYVTEKLDGCLDGNTLIDTIDGILSIQELCNIKYSGKVKSFDFCSRKVVYDDVINVSINDTDNHEWYEIMLDNGTTIIATDNHKFYIPKLNCFRSVINLLINDELGVF